MGIVFFLMSLYAFSYVSSLARSLFLPVPLSFSLSHCLWMHTLTHVHCAWSTKWLAEAICFLLGKIVFVLGNCEGFGGICGRKCVCVSLRAEGGQVGRVNVNLQACIHYHPPTTSPSPPTPDIFSSRVFRGKKKDMIIAPVG